MELNLLETLAHYADRQIATVELLEMKGRPAKLELERHTFIRDSMIEDCRRFGFTPERATRIQAHRLAAALRD